MNPRIMNTSLWGSVNKSQYEPNMKGVFQIGIQMPMGGWVSKNGAVEKNRWQQNRRKRIIPHSGKRILAG